MAHAPRNAVSAAYNHALYLEPRAKMMQDWADFLEPTQRGGKVLPFRGTALRHLCLADLRPRPEVSGTQPPQIYPRLVGMLPVELSGCAESRHAGHTSRIQRSC